MVWFLVIFVWLQWYGLQHDSEGAWDLSWWMLLVWAIWGDI